MSERRAVVGFVTFLLCYAAGGFLTAAYYQQHRVKKCDEPVYYFCPMQGPDTLAVGAIWPAYWAWRAALEITR